MWVISKHTVGKAVEVIKFDIVKSQGCLVSTLGQGEKYTNMRQLVCIKRKKQTKENLNFKSITLVKVLNIIPT